MNGAVGLSFKEKVAELCICRSHEQCTGLTEKNASIGKRASQTEAWYHEANMYTVHILRKL